MGRELRRVPPDWQHPKKEDGNGHYQPMYDQSYRAAAEAWIEKFQQWQRGEHPSQKDSPKFCDGYRFYWEYEEPPGPPECYRPDWPEESRTHFQMYEKTSEGTPLSPVFATIEEVARYCADNRASAFAGRTATYEQWLETCRAGYSVSAVIAPGHGLISGVEASEMFAKTSGTKEEATP